MSKPKRSEPDYEVGYGRPPKESQFKPGQSGNPRGRPKEAKGFKASLARELEAKITVREGDREVVMSKGEALAKRVVSMGLNGSLPAAAKIAEWEEHSPEKVMDTTTSLENDKLALEELLRIHGARLGPFDSPKEE